ncbi:MAG: FecR family protein [Thermoanaerobaculia bacterium]
MTSQRKKRPTSEDSFGPNGMERLIRLTGPRPGSAHYGLDKVRQEAVSRWEGVVARRRRRKTRARITTSLAVAAVVAVVAVGLRWFVPPIPDEPVGAVELVAHELQSRAPGGSRSLAAGDPFVANMLLDTGPAGLAALRLANGIGVRLDRDTRVRFRSPTRVILEQGAVFVDTSGSGQGDFLEVETRFGIARDVGTTFQVIQLPDGPVRVLVREGRVEVNRGAERHEARAGTQLLLLADGSVTTSTAPGFGPEWSWTLESSPPFPLDGATLGAFLDWLGGETGWQIRYEDVDRDARETVLHGSLEGVPVEQTPELVLPGSGLAHRLEGNTLVLMSEQNG